MKFTAASAICGVTAVSALSVPHHHGPTIKPWNPFSDLDLHKGAAQAGHGGKSSAAAAAGTLPLDKFGTFHTISLDDAKAGIVKAMKDFEDFMDDVGEVLEDIFNGTETETGKPGGKGIMGIPVLGSKQGSGKVQAAASASGCSNPNVRFEWRDYSDSDRHALMDAFRCLISKPSAGPQYAPSTNRFEDFARVHQTMTPSVHMSGLFLPWHRYFSWALEQEMRDVCGFDRAFPWWDESLDAGKFAESSLFTADFFGSLPTATNGAGTCIEDGAFAGLTCHIGPGSNSSTEHCLSRARDEGSTAQANADFVQTCNSRKVYSDMENCAELGPHGYGHNGIGSVMSDVAASPSDPVFYMHHLFIDRNFWLWQNADPRRKTQITGCADAKSPCTPLNLSTKINIGGLRPDVTVRDVLDTQGGKICYKYTY